MRQALKIHLWLLREEAQSQSDETVHTLSYPHKIRKRRQSGFAFTDGNVAWGP